MACHSSLLGSQLAENRIVLGDASWQFGLSSFVLRHFFLLGVSLGLSIRWAGVVKFFDPTYTYIKIYLYRLKIKLCKFVNRSI